jgi:hypothetical protein
MRMLRPSAHPSVCSPSRNAAKRACPGVVLAQPHQHPDPPDLTRLLRLSGDRRESDGESENNREPDQPHGHLGGGWLAGSLAERHDAHQPRTHTTPDARRVTGAVYLGATLIQASLQLGTFG